MRKIKYLFFGLFLCFVSHAKAEQCMLEHAPSLRAEGEAIQVLQTLTQLLPYPYTCNGNTLTITLPTQSQSYTLTLPIPFNLIEDQYPFQGLAKYYSGSREVTFKHWQGFKGRFLVFLVKAENARVQQDKHIMHIQVDAHQNATIKIYLGPASGEFSSIKYSYLWNWLAKICEIIDQLLVILGGLLGHAWGIAIIALAILFKLVCLPLQLWVAKLQARVDTCEAILKPKLKQIKSQYDGIDAHHLIMAEYKKLGITPFHTMKPLIGPMIQLPIQIAIFNVLGEMPALQGASFLWINDLAYPDIWIPILMTIISIIATVRVEKTRKKYYLYLMAIVFLVLFYPFPAGMVLFWTMMNVLHLLSFNRY